MNFITVRRDDLERLLRRLASVLPEQVEISTDYYLIISADEWDQLEMPPEPSVGSLFDDWAELSRHLSDEKRHFAVADIDRVGSLLHAISEAMVPLDSSGAA